MNKANEKYTYRLSTKIGHQHPKKITNNKQNFHNDNKSYESKNKNTEKNNSSDIAK